MKGFTLVELLVVIAILSILATIGVTNFQTAKIKARDLERKADLQTVAKSLEAYVNDHRGYPLSSGGQIICQPPATVCAWGAPFTDGTSVYAATLPEDESSTSDYTYVSTTGADYQLYTYLENSNDPDLTTFTPAVACGDQDCNYKIQSSNSP